MRAAWYEKQGPAQEVLVVGEMTDPRPAAGEVRIRITASGINPGDIKKRQDSFGSGMPYSRVIDGAGARIRSVRACLLVGRPGNMVLWRAVLSSVRHRSGILRPCVTARSTRADFSWAEGYLQPIP